MARPAFIYAFDNLGPERFTELCGDLLGSHYRGFGFLEGGVGSDGGVDGESFGILHTETKEDLFDNIVQPQKTIIFQFKHKVVARVGGQAQSRKKLLRLYTCSKKYTCELHRGLIKEKKPDVYILVTNVEVNSNFRKTFIERCRSENSDIPHYQIIGLDELENWITRETHLRHLYFPTIFGPPRFDLRINLSIANSSTPNTGTTNFERFLNISILNIGVVPSYISFISLKVIKDGEAQLIGLSSFEKGDVGNDGILRDSETDNLVQPGRKRGRGIPFNMLKQLGREFFLSEILVEDEIGNIYSTKMPVDIRETITKLES